MKKAIVIGASSGIGKELAIVLAENNYSVGLVGRRTELLVKLQKELPTNSFIKSFDVSNSEEAIQQLEGLIEEMKDVDLIIINAGVGFINTELDYEKEKRMIEVNVLGFTAIINVAYKHFASQGHGHIVGISSVAAVRGNHGAPAYSASKAFISNYMEGLRSKAKKEKIPLFITDIKPGFVDTAMAQGDGLFWVAPPRKAALQIYKAIIDKKDSAYITKRWRLIAWLLRVIPNRIYYKI